MITRVEKSEPDGRRGLSLAKNFFPEEKVSRHLSSQIQLDLVHNGEYVLRIGRTLWFGGIFVCGEFFFGMRGDLKVPSAYRPS